MNDEWRTPDDLYQALHKEFQFEFDLCANEQNAKCSAWANDIEKAVNDMAYVYGSFWMNPPYSRGNIDKCMKIAHELGEQRNTVVCLVRFDPSTEWFQKYVNGSATEVRMLDRRVKFIGAPSAYNFPCCIVIYDKGQFDIEKTEYSVWGWK